MMTNPKEIRLIEVAIDLFGREGLSAVGTRAIAEAAGVQMSAITYHFGGKEGLYLACAKYLAEEMRDRISPLLDQTQSSKSDGADEARDAILRILSGMVSITMNDDAASVARFIVREQMNPTPAFAILFEVAMQPVVERVDELLRTIAGRPVPREELRIRFVSLIGQVMTFRFARATLMRATGWESVGERETDAVRAIVIAHASAILSDLANGSPL